MVHAAAAFDAVAEEYDEPRRRLVPCFEEFYGTAVAAVADRLGAVAADAGLGAVAADAGLGAVAADAGLGAVGAARAADGGPRVLDLGAGTGLLAGRVAAAVPRVHLTLVDAAPAMLAVARRRLTALGAAHEVRVADLADPRALAGGPYDAVVSALAIHHLDDGGKRELFARVRGVLAPDGVFVNAEQVAGPTPALDRRYDAAWLDQIRALGASEAEIAGARRRMAYDRPSTVDDQCSWLRAAGFTDVDCYFKHWRFAVFGGGA